MASSGSSAFLPPLQAAIDQAPAGVNPFSYFAKELSWAVYPGIAGWSKPIFVIFAVLSFLNFLATLFALWIKWRREGHLPLYRMVDHRSGSKFICLNSTNIFLAFHALSSAVFTVFPLLHVFQYKIAGKTHMDLSWAVLMWLAPYLGLLMTCSGALYGIFLMPLSSTTRLPDGQLVPGTSKLSRTPCWILNSLVIGLPTLLTASIMIPGLRLIVSAQKVEAVAVDMSDMLTAAAPAYDQGDYPSLAWQTTILQKLQLLSEYGGDASSRWRPVYAVWTGWLTLGVLLSTVSAVAIYRVTKQRMQAARSDFGGDQLSDDSFELAQRKNSLTTLVSSTRRQKSSRSGSGVSSNPEFSAREGGTQSANPTRQNAAYERARWDHLNLTAHFTSAAVLLLISEAVFIAEVVVGYQVHLRLNLLAITLLIPIIAYVGQGSIAVALVIVRSVQGKLPPPSTRSGQSDPATLTPSMKGLRNSGSHSMKLSPSGNTAITFGNAQHGGNSIFRTISNTPRKAQGAGVIHIQDSTSCAALRGPGVPITVTQFTQVVYDDGDGDSANMTRSEKEKDAEKAVIQEPSTPASSTFDQDTLGHDQSSEPDFAFGRAL